MEDLPKDPRSPGCRYCVDQIGRRRHHEYLTFINSFTGLSYRCKEQCTVSWRVLVTSAVLALIQPAYSQQIPDNVRPGQIERQFERPPDSRAVDVVPTVDVPSQNAPPNAADISITVAAITIKGATSFTEAELLQPFPDIVGHSVPLTRIYDLANSITARYREAGFVLSRAVVGEQRLEREDARVVIDVIEGFVAGVEFVGEVAGRAGTRNKMADRVIGYRPHEQKHLERFLLLLNDMAGASASVTGVYVPIEGQPGAFKVIVNMAHKWANVFVNGTNRGSELLGPDQAEVMLRLNSVFRTYEQTTVRYITAGSGTELEFLSLGQSYWLGSNGTKLSWLVSQTDSIPDVGEDFGAFNLETESTFGSMILSHSVRRSRRNNVDLRLSVSYHDGLTENGLISSTRDQIASVRAGVTFDWVDSLRGVNIFDVEVSQGIDAFGASQPGDPDLSRPGGRPDYTKARAYLAREQYMGGPFSLLLAVDGQYSDDVLLGPEEFAVGGPVFGRAYDASEIVGDSGAGAKAELRMQFGGVGDNDSRVMFYGFYDYGFVLKEEPQIGENRRSSLESAGGGLRFSFLGWLNGYVEGAVPLSGDVAIEESDDTRIFGGISIQF